MKAPGSIDVADYRDEVARNEQDRPDDYHPATADEPRRILTWNGEALGGANNGEGHGDWTPRRNVTVHVAVTGSGYAYGTSVAACDGSMELGESAELSCLVELRKVDSRLLCRRPGCRALIKEARNEE
ncbi:hypothetical protein [Streptomyces sp. NRRL S-455]|uniref:hypothetical protein n=1 Tax=Streptomyces sp. NRRL S-455 TaxID=1463908 RepID=UPI0004C06685|nr:hypothetical protein [Streptomyces sp. NRRL S-455]